MILLERSKFRAAVFEREHGLCCVCSYADGKSKAAVDAHHIIERRLWPDGGYYIDNGVALCAEHHLQAETTDLSCELIRECAGIKKVVLPEHLYPDQIYDKWGNPILPNGTRMKGELFNDPSVFCVLANKLHLFTNRVKYPRTFHLPWSPGLGKGDRVMEDMSAFLADERVIITRKMDGECLSATTGVLMADDSRMTMRELVEDNHIGSFVLGVGKNGTVVPSKILRVWDRGPTADWLCVKVRKSGGSNPGGYIYCTSGHQFFVKGKGYIHAKDLSIGDVVLRFEKSTWLSDTAKEVLFGALRGGVVKKLKTATIVNDLYTYEVPVMAIDRRMPMLGKPRNGVGRSCYDIETETGNFFANGILVHNCTSLYRDGLHARSLEYHSDPRRDWIRAFHANIALEIPYDWRVCGENLFAVHSIAYDNLSSYFQMFSIWDNYNVCRPWDETVEWAQLLGIKTVPVLFDGEFRGFLKARESFIDPKHEGYVIRLACGFEYRRFKNVVAKYVRANHIQTTEHWKKKPMVKNLISETPA